MPTVIVNDIAGITSRYTAKRHPEIFGSHRGYLAEPTPENIELAKQEKLTVPLTELSKGQYRKCLSPEEAAQKGVHPISRMKERYMLSDRLHHRNMKYDADLYLRDIGLVESLASTNTQVIFSG